MHTTNATITDEFANGAYLMCHGLNSGIDGIKSNDPYPANTGELDRVTVQVNGSGNISPTCSITSPSNGVIYVVPANITINATASDANGTISRVEFYQGTTKLGEDTSSPYSYTWNNVPEGNYSLTVKAYDDALAVTTSQEVGIRVSNTASGILTVHPTNRRYLTDGTGKAIYLTGSHTWFLVQKGSFYGQMDNSYQNMEDYLNLVQSYSHNFQRLWTNFADYQGPFPWARTGPGTAWDGGLKFNMSQFDQSYFDLLRQRVLQITNRGMYCSVMLFGSGNEFRPEWPGTDGTNWSKCSWNPVNNINSALASVLSTSNGDTFYTSNTAALDIQKALIQKTIDTLNDIDNLMWEVINEPKYPASTVWQSAMVSYIKSYELNNKPKQHLVGMVGGWNQAGQILFDGPADWISPDNNPGGYMDDGGDPAYTNKVIINDTDHFWGYSDPQYAENMRKWVWKTFTSGHHPIFMDSYDACFQPYQCGSVDTRLNRVRAAMGHTLTYANKMDLVNVTPQPSLASTGYCLAKAGYEYLVYYPGGGSGTLNLTSVSGSFSVKWFNPYSGGSEIDGGTTTGGASRSFTPPFSGDAVLYLKNQVQDTTPPTAVASVRDGASATADSSSTNSTSQLSANWDTATDNESGISNYQYAIGTTAGGTQTLSWTTIGNVTTITKTGLTLTVGTTYYFSVRAISGGGTGLEANSNGQFVIIVPAGSFTNGSFEDNFNNWDLTSSNGGSVAAQIDSNEGVSDGAKACAFNAGNALGNAVVSQTFQGISGMVLSFDFGVYGQAHPQNLKVEVLTGGITVINQVITKTGPGNWNPTVFQRYTYSFTGAGNVTLRFTDQTTLADSSSCDGILDNITVETVNDTTPPGAPGTVRDGATAGVDISSTTSMTQVSATWTIATDNESGIANYQYAIGTAQGATDITNGWISNGTNLIVTKTGLSLFIGTTYYFGVRAVNGQGLTGNATNSNGQVVVSTTVPDTTPPSPPGSVKDGAIAGTDDSFTHSTTTLSANWTAATDSESGIANYQYAIGTTSGWTNVVPWTTLGNVLTVTKTGLNLTIGTTYYFSVKAINGFSLIGAAANSDGQFVKVINSSDTTRPIAPPVVRDGLEITDVESTYERTELSANWEVAIDTESGISRYWYAVGSSQGGTNIVIWTDNGAETSVTKTGLNLTSGTTYYFSVKAENGVGLQSSTTTSNGQYVMPGPVPLVILNVQVTNINTNSATITWITNVPVTSQVEYGLTAGYGSLTIEDTSLVISHSVALTGLITNKTYHYRVISKDQDGNEKKTGDFTFDIPTPVLPTPNKARPNPVDFHNGQQVTFDIGNAGGEAKIYTLTGKLLKKLAVGSGTTEIQWDGKNEAGQKVIRGIYLYKIKEANGSTTIGKLAVIR